METRSRQCSHKASAPS